MPGSPPISSAEPGTMPPPVTRSSSAIPVAIRGARMLIPDSGSSAITRPFPALPRPGPASTASVSSTSVFQSPQAAHLPTQRLATAPQLWHTKVDLAGLAIPLLIDAVHAPAHPGQQLITDGPGTFGKVVQGDTLAHHLDPGATLREHGWDIGYVDRDEIHRHAPDNRDGMRSEVAGGTGVSRQPAEGSQEAVGVAAGNGCDAGSPRHAIGRAVAHRFALRYLAHLEDPSRQPHDRSHRIGTDLERATAIQRDTGPNKIVVIIGTKKHAARIGEACRRRGQLRSQPVEKPALVGVVGVLRFIGTGEMAHDERGVEIH